MMAQSVSFNIFRMQTRLITDSLTKAPSVTICNNSHLRLWLVQQQNRQKHRNAIYKTEEAKKIRFYVVRRYLEYLKNYDKVLESNIPGAMKIYRVFMLGMKLFTKDLIDYAKIVRLLNAPNKKGFETLTRKEIELYHQMPKDMRRLTPFLIISTLPVVNKVIYALAYFLPRFLLCSHFWTLQQKAEFSVADLRDRLVNNRPLFRCVQEELHRLKCDAWLYKYWKQILAQIGSGLQPSMEQILKSKDLFREQPYHLLYLKRKHVKLLLKIHDLHTGWFRRTRLAERAVILKEMDKAIIREGGVHNMPLEAIKTACVIRGLNPMNMRTEDMIIWLNKWIIISKVVDQDNLSLLLHCPILLAYNEPSNWMLIYRHKR